MISERTVTLYASRNGKSTTHPPRGRFAVVAKVPGFQVRLELTIWYTQELTLRGHWQVTVKLPRYFGLHNRFGARDDPTHYPR